MSTAVVLMATTVMSSASQMYSGAQAMKAASAKASLQRQQAVLASQEANVEAKRKEEAATKLRKKQKMIFLKSGVGIGGSPLLILEETERDARIEADSIRDRGMAQANLGLKKAKQTFRAGRATLIGNTMKAVSTIGSTYVSGQAQGMWDNPGTGTTAPNNLGALSDKQASGLPTWAQQVRN